MTQFTIFTALLTVITIFYYKISKAKRRHELKRREKRLGLLQVPKLK